MSRPTLHVTNWASRKLHNPGGRRWTIMAKPRPQYGELGDGRILQLQPDEPDLDDIKAGRISVDEYQRRFLESVAWHIGQGRRLEPGFLQGELLNRVSIPVGDGDTLCCSCSKEAAAANNCHRVWSAALLLQFGWRVILDGVDFLAEIGSKAEGATS